MIVIKCHTIDSMTLPDLFRVLVTPNCFLLTVQTHSAWLIDPFNFLLTAIRAKQCKRKRREGCNRRILTIDATQLSPPLGAPLDSLTRAF